MGKNEDLDPGSGMNIPDIISRRNNFLGYIYLNSLIRIRDPESFWPWIRDPEWTNSDPG
jgi:hypothetical protein